MNRSKIKGTQFETAVVTYLQEHGFPYAERRAQRGINDAGDIAGVVGWCLELKNVKEMQLGPWMKEAMAESVHARTKRFAVVHKRRSHSTAESFVTMPLHVFAELLGDEG